MASSKKQALGRTFDSLIPKDLIQEEFDPTAQEDKNVSVPKHLLIQDIVPDPDQPRRLFTEQALQELADSIKLHGLLQPIVVMGEGDKYRIIAGERRWRASQMAGLTHIPALVRNMSDQARLEVALIENLQREDLTPLEMATAYVKLHKQHNVTIRDIAKRVGKGESTVSNVTRLLRLPEAAKQALASLRISEQHARAILSLEGDPKKQQELLDLILKHNWTATKAEQFVIAYKAGATTPTEALKHTKTETPETNLISKKLKAQVTIRHMAKGGRLIIEFKDDKDYSRITKLLS